jgi:hypothetical protein
MPRNLPTPPPRIAKLPRNHAGYPVPWFVAWIDGQPDFRVIRANGIDDALRFSTCWLCGGPLGSNAAFVIGPMCAVNRVSAEPPSHRDCAIYAAQACPFLTNPSMRRRDTNLPQDASAPDGDMICRNPGVALVWITRAWRPMPGYRLFEVGTPLHTLWFAEGREATRTEVLAAIDSGMPILRRSAEQDPQPKKALAALEAQHAEALRLIPAGSVR